MILSEPIQVPHTQWVWRNGVRVQKPVTLTVLSTPAPLAGTCVPHVFNGAGSLCSACYGDFEDYRHYLPQDRQQRYDKEISNKCQ